MKRGCSGVLLLVLGIPALLFVGWQLHLSQRVGNLKSWNQKLTIEVETPNGIVSGSSVGKVYKALNHNIPGRGTVGVSSFAGEAAFVELAPGKYLFALINGADGWAQKVFAEEIGLVGASARYRDYDEWTQAIVDLRKEKKFHQKIIRS